MRNVECAVFIQLLLFKDVYVLSINLMVELVKGFICRNPIKIHSYFITCVILISKSFTWTVYHIFTFIFTLVHIYIHLIYPPYIYDLSSYSSTLKLEMSCIFVLKRKQANVIQMYNTTICNFFQLMK